MHSNENEDEVKQVAAGFVSRPATAHYICFYTVNNNKVSFHYYRVSGHICLFNDNVMLLLLVSFLVELNSIIFRPFSFKLTSIRYEIKNENLKTGSIKCIK